MPRASAEGRAAAAFRAGGKHRAPPKHLTPDAKAIWVEIVQARPVDYFAPGSFELLEQYCELTVLQRKTLALIAQGHERDDMGASYINRARELAHILATLATKLRLSIQSSVDRKSRMLDEKASDVNADRLLGGAAVWGDEDRPN